MVVAWVLARVAVKVAVKVVVEAAKVVVNKHAKRCVVTLVAEVVGIHAKHLVEGTVVVPVVPHAGCPAVKHVPEHVDSIARGAAMVGAQKLFQIR